MLKPSARTERLVAIKVALEQERLAERLSYAFIAERSGVGETYVRHQFDEDEVNAHPSMADLEVYLDLLPGLARRLGLQRPARLHAQAEPFPRSFARAARELGDVVTKGAEAIADQTMNAVELAVLEKEIREAEKALAALREAAHAMGAAVPHIGSSSRS